MEFLNTNSGSIQAIFGVLLFFVTLAYTVISLKMWNEMKLNRIKFETPDISIKLIQKEATEYDIEISNQSNSEIYDLIFTEIPNLEKTWPKGTANIGFLKNGISYMCKGQKYRSSFLRTTQYIKEIENENETQYLIFKYYLYDRPESYKNRKKFNKEIKINLSLIDNTATKPIFDIALVDQIKELNKNIQKISESITKINSPSNDEE